STSPAWARLVPDRWRTAYRQGHARLGRDPGAGPCRARPVRVLRLVPAPTAGQARGPVRPHDPRGPLARLALRSAAPAEPRHLARVLRSDRAADDARDLGVGTDRRLRCAGLGGERAPGRLGWQGGRRLPLL